MSELKCNLCSSFLEFNAPLRWSIGQGESNVVNCLGILVWCIRSEILWMIATIW